MRVSRGRTATSARYLVSLDRQFHKTSRAYRIASAEAAELCREAWRKDDKERGKEEE